LIRIASRRHIEQSRNVSARRRREDTFAALEPTLGEDVAMTDDDSLTLLLLCCHPSLTPALQVALTRHDTFFRPD
jgi:predicted RNA polymerase sigma factor